MLLSKKITLSDMEYVDMEFYNSVKYILENDPEPLCLTFSASREFVGQVCGVCVWSDVFCRVECILDDGSWHFMYII